MIPPTIKLIALTAIGLVVGTYCEASQLTPRQIEKKANSIAEGQNIDGDAGKALEDLYQTINKDGVWNCQDRAEFAVKLARSQGYHAIWEDQYGWKMPLKNGKIVGHRFVKIYDGHKEYKILNKDYEKEKRKMLRRISG